MAQPPLENHHVSGSEASPDLAIDTISGLPRYLMSFNGRALTLERAFTEALGAGTLSPVDTAGLTPREMDVLRIIVHGNSNRSIAAALFLSERTVENHVTHILAKLGLESRTAAAAFALQRGLV
jgi:DNA-binding NarL/FixJ family response regulator